MSTATTTNALGSNHDPHQAFDGIARRIGRRLRDFYPNPETEPLPAEFAQKLLELRQKERERSLRR